QDRYGTGCCLDPAGAGVGWHWDRGASVSAGLGASRRRSLTTREEVVGLVFMSLCLQIVREPAGIWSVHGLTNRPVARLPSLAASVDYARRECAEAPATIEFMIDGFYAVAHQREGWPRRLVVQEVNAPRIVPAEIGAQGRPLSTRCREWMTGRRRRRSAFV